jgi:hypothetical protein
LLFLVYIKDMPGYVRSQTRLFADDCLMYRKVSSTSDCDWGKVPMFLLKKAKVLFASTWVFQERFLEILRPRHFVESTC